MIGIGAANVAAGFFQGFAVSTSGSRTAVAEQSGAKSQADRRRRRRRCSSCCCCSSTACSPTCRSRRSRAVVIAAALSLVNVRALRRYWRVRPSSFVLSLVASLGVIVLGVLQGIVIAIFLAVLLFFRRSWWPHGAVLGRSRRHRGLAQHRRRSTDRPRCPACVVYRWEAPLFFANAGAFRQQIRKLVRSASPAWVVIQCEAITDIDVTAAEMLEQLDNELNAAGRPHGVRRSCAPASRISCIATACSRPSTATTSTRASTLPCTRSVSPTEDQYRTGISRTARFSGAPCVRTVRFGSSTFFR